MKYIKLYEAFKSKGIYKTLSFLKDRVGQNQSNKFLDGLKYFMRYSDIPIDKISDDDLKYMKVKTALQLRTEDKVSNNKGIEFIKFWFSLEKGYLGYTGTGNKELDALESRYQSGGITSGEKFTDYELEYISSNKELKGEIYPVTNYNKLKTGDSVVGFFENDKNWRRFDVATIYVEDNYRYYALQNVADGSSPDDDSNWSTRFGKRYSWFIYEINGELANDHRCLHYYKPTSEELHYVEEPKEEKEESTEEDPLKWNLPFGSDLDFRGWGSRVEGITKEELKEADFALVLYYDEMKKSVDSSYKPVSDIKRSRKEEKEGASAFMSDDEVRRQNLEKYISKLSSNIEISKEDLSNLGKIVIKAILGEFSFISIYQNRKSNLDRLVNICNELYVLMSTDVDNEYYIESIKNSYKRINKTYYEDLSYSLQIKSLIKGTKAEEIFKKIFELGKLISDLIRKQNAKSIDDVLILYQKISSIRSFMHLEQNRLNYIVRSMFGEFYSKSSFEYYLKDLEASWTDSDYQKDIQRLERIEKYIKSIFS